jgi:hypothetical protein
MIPPAFFVMSYAAITILGLIVLVLLPSFRVTILNLLLFDLGAVPGGIAFLYVYGRLFADSRFSGNALGIFLALVLGGTTGGVLAVWLKMWFATSPNMRSLR